MSNKVSSDVVPAKELHLSFGEPSGSTSSSTLLEISLCSYMGVGIGGVEWPAACMFCQVIAHNEFYKRLFTGKSILELGAGTGLGGIAVEKLCGSENSPTEIVITDLEQYLDHLRRNIAMNSTRLCSVWPLDWLNIDVFIKSRSQSAGHTFDIILALECVYREDLYQPLIDTILRTSTKDTLIFLGLTRLFAQHIFFDLLHANGIYYTRLPEHSLPLKVRKESATADCGLLLLYFKK
jgi:hypothetical protein